MFTIAFLLSAAWFENRKSDLAMLMVIMAMLAMLVDLVLISVLIEALSQIL